jgi:hypothetical protein
MGGLPNLDPPAPEDDDNIIAALEQSSRVRSVSLTVTISLLKKLSKITEPLVELEELTLLSSDHTQLSLPNTFRCGPRLRTLHSTRVYFTLIPTAAVALPRPRGCSASQSFWSWVFFSRSNHECVVQG